jgi:hypothetical protein
MGQDVLNTIAQRLETDVLTATQSEVTVEKLVGPDTTIIVKYNPWDSLWRIFELTNESNVQLRSFQSHHINDVSKCVLNWANTHQLSQLVPW